MAGCYNTFASSFPNKICGERNRIGCLPMPTKINLHYTERQRRSHKIVSIKSLFIVLYHARDVVNSCIVGARRVNEVFLKILYIFLLHASVWANSFVVSLS